jgi:hypothetical protein
MMRLNGEELEDRAYAVLEPQAAAALTQLQDALNAVADPQQREAIWNAALTYAFHLADAAITLGWQMHADPGAWLFGE